MLKKLSTQRIYVGVDEAGRGALAGPVVAAAVYISRHPSFLEEVRDSKKLSAQKRETLYEKLINHSSIAHGIGTATVEEIDQLNILEATYRAMHRALGDLDVETEHIYVDGSRYRGCDETPYSCIVGGDDKYVSIASASILAKVYRDRIMIEAAQLYPAYELASNKGYGTTTHRAALRQHGYTDFHRRSFRLREDR